MQRPDQRMLRWLRDGVVPKAHRAQAESDALVAEAAADLAAAGYGLSPDHFIRHNVVRLLVAMFAITGTMDFRRGWVRSVMLALDEAGCTHSTQVTLRWFRSNLVRDPEQFAGVPGLDAEAFADICSRAGHSS
jgi:hypothetical protein